MGKFTKIETPIPGLFEVMSTVFGKEDPRGIFLERWNIEELLEIGIDLRTNLRQGNESVSHKGAFRGMHFQIKNPQAKYVWVTQGIAFDAVIDIRPGSKTHGQWYGLILSADDPKCLYMPAGFAHGFLALSEGTRFQYLVSGGKYDPKDEGGIIWNDPDVNIQWPLEEYGLTEADIILSDKDRINPRLRDLKS